MSKIFNASRLHTLSLGLLLGLQLLFSQQPIPLTNSLVTYKSGSDRKEWLERENRFRAGDVNAKLELEKEMVSLLENKEATTDTKLQALRLLEIYGTKASLPTILKATQTPTLQEYAWMALEKRELSESEIKPYLQLDSAACWRLLIKRGSAEWIEKAGSTISEKNPALSLILLKSLSELGSINASQAILKANAPSSLQLDRDRALLECSSKMYKNGQKKEALELLNKLGDKSKPSILRASVLTQKIHFLLANAATIREAEGTLLQMLVDPDREIRKSGVVIMRSFPSIDFLSPKIPTLPVDVLAGLLDALQQKPSKTFIPPLYELIKGSSEESIKVLSLLTLGYIGDSTSINFILSQWEKGGELKKSSEVALATLRDPQVNKAIRALWIADQSEKAKMLMRISAERMDFDAVPNLMKIAQDKSNPLCSSAWNAWALLSKESDFEKMIAAGINLEDPKAIAALKTSLATCIKKISDKNKLISSLEKAYKESSAKPTCSAYLYTVAQIDSPASRALLLQIAKKGEERNSVEALLLLSDQPNQSIKNEFKTIAKESLYPKARIIAIQSYIRILKSEEETPAQILFENYKEIFSIAERANEKNLIIDSLSELDLPNVEAFLTSCLSQTEIQANAQKGIERIKKSITIELDNTSKESQLKNSKTPAPEGKTLAENQKFNATFDIVTEASYDLSITYSANQASPVVIQIGEEQLESNLNRSPEEKSITKKLGMTQLKSGKNQSLTFHVKKGSIVLKKIRLLPQS